MSVNNLILKVPGKQVSPYRDPIINLKDIIMLINLNEETSIELENTIVNVIPAWKWMLGGEEKSQ